MSRSGADRRRHQRSPEAGDIPALRPDPGIGVGHGLRAPPRTALPGDGGCTAPAGQSWRRYRCPKMLAPSYPFAAKMSAAAEQRRPGLLGGHTGSASPISSRVGDDRGRDVAARTALSGEVTSTDRPAHGGLCSNLGSGSGRSAGVGRDHGRGVYLRATAAHLPCQRQPQGMGLEK